MRGPKQSTLQVFQCEFAERIYASTRREPLGRSWVRGHELPPEGCTFGRPPTDAGERAVQAIFPTGRPWQSSQDPSHPQHALYIRSHGSHGPGEQRRRGYNWAGAGLDPTEHVFGLSAGAPRASCTTAYSAAEQQPDADLGRSLRPGWRNVAPPGKVSGLHTAGGNNSARSYGAAADTLSPPKLCPAMASSDYLSSPDTKAAEMTHEDVEKKPVSLASVIGAMSDSDLEALDEHSDVSVSIPDAEARDSEGMTVAFKDLSYTVWNSANKKQKIKLLTEVSGFMPPGHLSALMGPSGSSKTTLLDVLAGRKTVGTISGQILFAGQHATRTFLRRYTGYVEQFDTLLGNLTVYEMLAYTAELKNPMYEPFEQKAAKVEQVLQQLGLSGCRGVRIGSQLARGISGGQCKRVNIGIALVTNPRVLFLDEPTSGLDSYTSNEVMTVVKGLTKTGITICATIHNPTPYCFNLFDRLMILLHGRVVYSGENGPAAVRYFEQFPEVTPFGQRGSFHNKAEWIVDLTTRADREGKHAEYANRYDRSDLKVANLKELNMQIDRGYRVSDEQLKELAVRTETTNPWYWGIRTLAKWRATRDFADPQFLGPRIMDKVVLALIIMTLYWKIGDNRALSNYSNLTAVLFLWTILPGYAATAFIPTIVLERPLFVRERNDGLYRPITYLVFKMMEELIIVLCNSLVLSAVVFYPLKLSGDFTLFWLVFLTTSSIGIVLAYAIAAVSPTMDIANAALPAYVTSLLFFVGLLLRIQDQPNYWKWYGYLDFLRYAWGAQMCNQFEGQTTVVLDQQTALQFYGLSEENKWAQLGYEATFFALFFFLAWLALAYKKVQNR
ncbi:hypothetical protein WJX81_005585 [Elliptochloris bilobata]|uniref:ABC transporter domain-containing protein n=1 Tax=Elliptochloris bilobata TaxID=381761 RepID=A0AAW1QNR7_9CHLO